MYLSILGGAIWGVPIALPLACTCVATGATLCYFISAALGPALLTVPKWQAKFEVWTEKIRGHKDNIISFLIVLRLPPSLHIGSSMCSARILALGLSPSGSVHGWGFSVLQSSTPPLAEV